MSLASLFLLLIICTLISSSGFLLNKKHLLISLLYLESFILALVLLYPIATIQTSAYLIHYRIILLATGACEARIGLALIVIIMRTYGSDIINSISLNKC